MRMSRWEWLAQYFKLRPRAKIQRKKHDRREKSRWHVLVGSKLVHGIMAHTASEARALAKKELGIGRKGRLPVGAKVTRLT